MCFNEPEIKGCRPFYLLRFQLNEIFLIPYSYQSSRAKRLFKRFYKYFFKRLQTFVALLIHSTEPIQLKFKVEVEMEERKKALNY